MSIIKQSTALIIILFVFFINVDGLSAQTQKSSLRVSMGFEKEVVKNLKIELYPEVRFNNGFTLSTLLVQTGISYKIFPWLRLGSLYRLEAEYTPLSEEQDDLKLEYSNRFAFDANSKLKVGRFTPKLRLRFSNFTDFDSFTDDKSNYLRYRLGMDYNVRGVKLTPYVSVEFYHKLKSGLISKTLYTIGTEYKINTSNAVSLEYSYDKKYSTLDRQHVFELSYKFSF